MKKRWLSTLALVLSGILPGLAVQTENHGIHAVPVPHSTGSGQAGKVIIDGKLDDWDLSGQVLQCYDIEALKDVYSGQIAMMYDAGNLYVSIHWKDATPMGNVHDPHYQADKGWAGDCVQLRIKTDLICHLTAWYYAPKQEPFINIQYGKSLTEPFGGPGKNLFRTEGWKLSDGAEMAFLKDKDGKGYVQEIKLPWKLITKEKTYAAGDRLACGIELLWGEADWPVHRYADNLAEGATSREFFWTAHNAWGPVILEPKGNLKLPPPAYLKALEPETPRGPVAIDYKLPADARVTLAIDDATGRRVRNLIPALPRKKGRNEDLWDGLDDNGKPVPPGDYTFTGLYHQGIHVNYVMSFCSPGNPSWDTADGRGAFYADHTAPQAAAAAGDYVALACPMGEAGRHLIGCDLNGQRLWGLANRTFGDGRHICLATDGKLLWVAMEGRQSFIYRVEMATGQYAPWDATAKDAEGRDYRILELVVSDRPGYADDKLNLSSIALRNGVLAVCLARENKISLRDAETGAEKSMLTVPDPRAVVFDDDKSLIVLFQDALKRVALDGTISPFAEGTFPAGYGLAIDTNRNVYLSVRGNDQNVKVFSPDGKPIREIGKKGGRPSYGPFDDKGMLNPGQLAIDSKGRLWVPEENHNPKRTSLWNTDGAFIRDYVGSTSYAGAGAIDPHDPTMAFAENTVFKIDLATGAWRPVYSFAKRDDPADLFPPSAQSRCRVVVRDGLTYLYTTDAARGATEAHCTMLKDGQWRSAAHLGIVVRKKEGEWEKYMSPLFEGHDGAAYAWADKNGDGLVQADELTFATNVTWRSFYWGQLPGPDGLLAFPGKDCILEFPITGVTACGAPLYDVAHPRTIKPDLPPTGGEGMVMAGSQGRVYLNQDPLMGVDANGRVLFTYPSHHVSVHGSHTARAARPGYLIGPSSILGTADYGDDIGEVFYLNGNLGENYLFTSDGLWIQSLFKDVRGGFEMPSQAIRGMPFDGTTAGGESFGGNFIRADDGRTYLVLGGTDARVLEITGLETLKRFNGKFAYTPKQYAAAQELARQTAAKAMELKKCVVARTKTAPVIDGKPADWPELLDDAKPCIEIEESAQRRYGRVLARYDDNNLYLAYRVFSGGSMKNAGQDNKLLFKTGDAVDLMLGPAKSRKGEGNLRLLMSVLAGKPMAVLYRKVVPGTPEKERVAFSSPWRTIEFDRVTLPEEIKVATGPAPGGYFVEAQVPWSTLDVKPESGLKLRGDFGVLFADHGGTVTVSRQYWSDKATGLVNDVPGEADLAPELWGDLTLE